MDCQLTRQTVSKLSAQEFELRAQLSRKEAARGEAEKQCQLLREAAKNLEQQLQATKAILKNPAKVLGSAAS